MTKEKLLDALNAIQNGEDIGSFHDELETLITIVVNASDEAIAAAWDDLTIDTE